jgi:hypothetical protein
MSKAVNEKWKKTFPDTIGNQNRPAEGVDDTQPFETGAFPQYMANDPVRYDLQNAAMSQSMSNDARLKEMVDARGKELDDHKVDPGAHKTGIAGNAATATKVVTNAANGASANIAEATMGGSDYARVRVSGKDGSSELALETADDGNEAIVARQYTGDFKDVARTAAILDANGNTSFPGTVVAPKFTGELNGNAATATKLQTPRTISLTGKATGSTTFDGSSNASINVTSVNADTASKLSSARKINITGDATGAAAFDGSGDISISTTVNESEHAAAADTLKSSAASETSAIARPVWLSDENDNTKQVVSPNLTYTCSTKTLTAANFAGHLAGNADSATTATKLATDRTISLTGDATGAANFDGSGDVSINVNVNSATKATNDGNGANIVATYLNKAGDTATGAIIAPSFQTGTTEANYFQCKKFRGEGNADTYFHAVDFGYASHDQVDFYEYGGTWNFYHNRERTKGGTLVGSIRPNGWNGNVVGNVTGNADTATNADTVDGYHASDIISKIYPVGSIYMSMSATNPATLFGVGTWERISQGCMLLGADDSTYKAGATGGEAAHTLSVNEMPNHSHGISNSGNHTHYFYGSNNNNGQFTEGDGIDTEGNSHFTHNERFLTSSAGAHTHTIDNAGGGAAHNNMPPYLVCYIWQRTA